MSVTAPESSTAAPAARGARHALARFPATDLGLHLRPLPVDVCSVTFPDLPEALFRDLVDAASDFVGTIDRNGNIVYINPAGRRLLEIPEDEDIVGQSVLPYNEPPSEVLRATAKILENSDEQWTGVSLFVSRSGRRIPMSQMMVSHQSGGKQWYSTIAREITAQLAREEELRHRADHDPLTGLLNRRAFRQHIGASEFAMPALIMMIDLDGFKAVNDSHGHHRGDLLLQDVARELRQATPAVNSVAARMGGDEFVVLLQAPTVEVLDHAVRSLETNLFGALTSYGASASIGTASLATAEGLDDALQAADRQLYEQKRRRALSQFDRVDEPMHT